MARLLLGVLALAWAASLAGPAAAQTRPLLTEEATTAPAGTLVLETGGDFISGQPNYVTGERRYRLDGPLLRLVHSPSDAAEIDLEWVARVAGLGETGASNVSDWGDVTLRAKVRFVEARGSRPALGARFGVTWAETGFGRGQGNGLGPNTLRTYAQMLLTRTAGPYTVHFNAGLELFDEVRRPHEQADFLIYGLAGSRKVGSRTEILAEASGLWGKGSPGTDEMGEVRLGLRGQAGPRKRWDVALRRGFTHATGRWGVTAGFRWTLREP